MTEVNIVFENFIFDFGQVLVHFEPDYMTKAYIKDEKDAALARNIIFDRLYWDRLDLGTITDEEVKEGIRSRLPERLHDSALKVYDNWVYNIPLIDGMRKLILNLKTKGKKIYLLSNISIYFSKTYPSSPEVAELLSHFDGIVLSGPIGLIKPSKDIFNHLLTKYSIAAKDCIFIDDNKANIDGAESVGIEGYLFDGDANKLKKYLNL